jgi:hypothetical protein
MMQEYSTPEGLDRLEQRVRDFAREAADDILVVVQDNLGGFLNRSMPALETALGDAISAAGNALGEQIGQALTPLADQLTQSVGNIVGDAVGDPAAGDLIGEQLGEMLGERITNLTSEVLGEQISEVLQNTVDNALSRLTDSLTAASAGLRSEDHALLLESRARVVKYDQPDEEVESDDALSGAWGGMVTQLNSLMNLIPIAVDTLQNAGTEVDRLSANLDAIFDNFATKGPEIFDTVSGYWNLIWGLYFFFFGTLTLGILYYGFWASGYFGGPQPIPESQEQVQPVDMMGRCSMLWNQCCTCLRGCHDTDLCFWSCILLMQVLILIVFVISLVLCILAGVQAMLTSGCAQIYMLAEPTVCMETLGTLRRWLSSFSIGGSGAPLEGACDSEQLLTCSLMADRMASAVVLTTVFSFLAVILSLQLLIESACLHERAKWMREVNRLTKVV